MITLLFVFLFASAKQNIPNPIGDEAWIKLTCHGIVSPRTAYPVVEKKIMVGHIRINPAHLYPRMDNLRDANSGFFKNLTKVCTERRWAKVELGNFSGTWMDWGSDWALSRLEIGETFIAAANVGNCRPVEGPCVQASQCCGSAQHHTTCNVAANTCESTAIIADTGNNASPN